MSIDGFNYKNLANTFAKQAFDLLPKDVSNKNAEYIRNLIGNFSLLAGEAVAKCDNIEFDNQQATFLVQLVAEWSFHKAIDLTRSKIPETHRDEILQKVAFVVYEITKQAFERNLAQDVILSAVEYHVDKSYKKSLKDLLDKNYISKEIFDHALSLSNVDDMAEKFKSKNNNQKQAIVTDLDSKSEPKNKKIFLKYIIDNSLHIIIVFVIFFVIFVSALLVNILDNLNFSIQPWIVFSGVLIVVVCISYIFANRYMQKRLRQLETIRQNLQDLVDPNKMYDRLGVDVLKIWLGESLLLIADPAQEGQLLSKVAALRQKLTDTMGYVIPDIRLQDDSRLLPNQYKILVRDKVVATGFVYPNKVMVKVDNCDAQGIDIQENSVIAVNYLDEKVVWLDENVLSDDIEYYSPEDVIIEHLKLICFEHSDKIMSISDVEKLIKLVASDSEKLSYEVLYCINIFELKTILVNLIKDGVSIKDIIFVFEKIAEYSHLDSDTDFITEKVKQVFLDS